MISSSLSAFFFGFFFFFFFFNEKEQRFSFALITAVVGLCVSRLVYWKENDWLLLLSPPTLFRVLLNYLKKI